MREFEVKKKIEVGMLHLRAGVTDTSYLILFNRLRGNEPFTISCINFVCLSSDGNIRRTRKVFRQ